MRFRKILSLLVCLGLVFTLMDCDSGSTSAETKKPRIISIGTAALGGTYYPMGVGLGSIIEKNVEGVVVTIEMTGGTVENPALIAEDKLDIAISNEHMAEFARVGKAPFDKLKSHNIAALASGLAPGALQYATAADSGIMTPEDLRGKTIAVGPQGNSSNFVIRDVLEFYGIGWDEIRPSYLSFSEGMVALADGRVDVAIAQAGIPTPAIVELAAGRLDFRLLNLPRREELLKKYPYYVKFDIPAGTYKGQDTVVETIATINIIIVNSKLDEDLVYRITKALFENIDDFYAAHPSTKTLSLEVAPKTAIPLHPGAARYYREKGVLQ